MGLDTGGQLWEVRWGSDTVVKAGKAVVVVVMTLTAQLGTQMLESSVVI